MTLSGAIQNLKPLSVVAVIVTIFFSFLAFAQERPSKDDHRKEAMTQERIAEIVGAYAGSTSGPINSLAFNFQGADLVLISDAVANRMRIISPVTPIAELGQEEIIATLVSNYHLALDARYAIGDGLLYAAYIHPLAELTQAQLESAIRQVATLRNTFGSSYTSGELSFGVQAPQGQGI